MRMILKNTLLVALFYTCCLTLNHAQAQINTIHHMTKDTVFCMDGNNVAAILNTRKMFNDRTPALDSLIINTFRYLGPGYSSGAFNFSSDIVSIDSNNTCGKRILAMYRTYNNERSGDQAIRIMNQACSFKLGWVENSPGICDAGGPPPICARKDHWHQEEHSYSLWLKRQRETYVKRLTDMVNEAAGCRVAISGTNTAKKEEVKAPQTVKPTVNNLPANTTQNSSSTVTKSSTSSTVNKTKPMSNADKGFWDETGGNSSIPHTSSNYASNAEKPVQSNTTAVNNYQNPYKYTAPKKNTTTQAPPPTLSSPC